MRFSQISPVRGEFHKCLELIEIFQFGTIPSMREIFTVFLHVTVILIRLARPGGFRSVVAESALVRHPLLILNRGRKRAPNLRVSDRISVPY